MIKPKMDISIPVYLKEKESFNREEKNGIYSLMLRDHPELGYVKINQMTMDIIEMCNGSCSVQEIVHHIQNTYDVPRKAKVYEDIDGTMHLMWRLGLIRFKSCNYLLEKYQMSKRGYTYIYMQKEDALEFNFIECPVMLRSAYIDIITDYIPQAISIRWLGCYESYFKVLFKNEEVFRVAVRLNRYIKGYEITLLYISKPNNLVEICSELFRFIDYMYKNTFSVDISTGERPVFHFYSFENEFKEMGFLLKGELKHEINNRSVFLFEYQINN